MISPAIHFHGTCAEAIALYQKAFNATIHSVDYYCDAPPDSGLQVTDTMHDLIMHSELTICGTRVNMSDTQENVTLGNIIILNAFFDSPEDVCNAFNVLKDGGKVHIPLNPQFFSPMYGSVEDRFGVRWQLITEQQGVTE